MPITVIQPEVVWPKNGEPVDEFDNDQEHTETTLAQLPVPASDLAFGDGFNFGTRSVVKFGRLVPLVIVNRGAVENGEPKGFDVCTKCGHVPLGEDEFRSHTRHYRLPSYLRVGAQCNGSPQHVFLGYEFQTDVVLLRTALVRSFASDIRDKESAPQLKAACMSLSQALGLQAASDLDIDSRELEAGYRLRRTEADESFVELYLYDSLTGGAGYSKAVGERFPEIFRKTLERLQSCTCFSSCSNCLRTYHNRMNHSSLDRRLAYELGQYILSGSVPEITSLDDQRRILSPLREMLELAGWSCRPGLNTAYEISNGSMHTHVHLRPALLDPSALPEDWGHGVIVNAFELEKDLPSCLLKLPA